MALEVFTDAILFPSTGEKLSIFCPDEKNSNPVEVPLFSVDMPNLFRLSNIEIEDINFVFFELSKDKNIFRTTKSKTNKR